ncbi:MAG: hypothetical protein U0704_05535 [Candidatus Eisenbacteria bacterium]
MSYARSWSNGFARDDGELLPAIFARGESPLTLLTSDFWAPARRLSGLWRPVVSWSFWLDGHLGGGSPAWFHVANTLQHALVTALLCALLCAHGLPTIAVLLGAAWFAVAPVHAEAVAWVVGRTDVLCGLFAIAALALDRRALANGRRVTAMAAALAYGAALGSKESAIGLPLVALAMDRAAAQRPALRASLARLAPWALVAGAWALAHRAWATPGAGITIYQSPDDVARRAVLAWSLVPHFLAAMLPGVAHAPDALPREWGGVLVGASTTLAGVALAVWLAWRRSPAAAPVLLFLAPVLPLVGAALMGRALPSGERLAYLPSAGIAWLLALAVASARGRMQVPLVRVALGALVAISAFECVRLQPAWHDDASVYAAMVAAQPRNPVGWIGSADAAAQAGDRATAERRLQVAARLGPRVPARHFVRAAMHYRYGEWEAVAASSDSALALVPGFTDARVLRATALVRLRRLDEAAADTHELLAARPDDPQALSVEGQRLLLAGEWLRAADLLDRAVSGAPDDVASWYALGVANERAERASEAGRAFSRVVALDPSSYDGWLGLARANGATGDTEGAATALARASTLPEAADGRAAALADQLASGTPPALRGQRRASTRRG